jgi:hypothetical protein
MKNEEEVERDKKPVDDQLDETVCERVFSEPFHMYSRLNWKTSRWQRLSRLA